MKYWLWEYYSRDPNPGSFQPLFTPVPLSQNLPDPVKMLNSAIYELLISGLMIIRGFTENRRYFVPGKVR